MWREAVVLLLTHVDVFDGYHMLRDQTVVVRDGMLREVRSARKDDAGPSRRGMTLLPGLIDAHCHVAGEDSLEQAAALGVTTELDMFGYPNMLMPIRKELAEGKHPDAADFRTSGPGANAPKGHPSELGGPPFPALAPGPITFRFCTTIPCRA